MQRPLTSAPPLLAALLLYVVPAMGDYSPPAFYDLVGASDVIAYGEITAVQERTFDLRVERWIAGAPKGATSLRIKRFDNWTCSFRWAPYAQGQRVLVFLRRDAASGAKLGTPWVLRSAGGEGEMPLLPKGQVALRGVPVPGMKWGPIPVAGSAVHGAQVPLSTFVTVIERFRRCFALKLERNPWIRVTRVRTVCDPGVLSVRVVMGQSGLHAHDLRVDEFQLEADGGPVLRAVAIGVDVVLQQTQ